MQANVAASESPMRDAHARRRRRRIAHDVAQAAHRLADRAEAGLPRIGPGLPEAGDADHDQARIDRRQLGPAEAPLLHRAGPEVLEQEVGLLDQVLEQRLAVGLAQVERDRLLVARDDRPPQRLAVRLLAAPDAHRVALARRLDLDDLGAEVAEQLAAERAGQQGAEFDHAQARERARFEAGSGWSCEVVRSFGRSGFYPAAAPRVKKCRACAAWIHAAALVCSPAEGCTSMLAA